MSTVETQEARNRGEELNQIRESLTELKVKEKEAREVFVAAMHRAHLEEIVIGDKKYEVEFVEEYKVRTKKA